MDGGGFTGGGVERLVTTVFKVRTEEEAKGTKGFGFEVMGGERVGEERHLLREGRGTVSGDKQRLVPISETEGTCKSTCIAAGAEGEARESDGWLERRAENLFPRTGTYFWVGVLGRGFFLKGCLRRV